MKKYVFIASIILLAACNNNKTQNDAVANPNPDPPTINYSVIKVLPHDTSVYTEGFEFHDGFLYESGGDPDYIGKSKLVKTEIATGKSVLETKPGKEYFGEGITMLNGKIYQMTWKEKTCFVYDAKTFKLLKKLSYDGEGWGMTNDGKQIIMDDKTNNLVYRDPETFAVIKQVPVSDNHGPEESINELEYVNGFIYANVYLSNTILKIDPSTGKVVGEMDMTGIREKNGVSADPSMPDNGLVLNGIAYDAATSIFYITGKQWPAVFEIKLN
jgi:glutamine cyclotransferase